jgi:hypothetical protein
MTGEHKRLASRLAVAISAVTLTATLAACGSSNEDAGVALDKETMSPVTGAELDDAALRITTTSDDRNWPLAAVSRSEPPNASLVVEIVGQDPSPALEDEIAALVSVPVTFRYVAGTGIVRPAPRGDGT